jgi:hypothetical protein
MSSTLATSGQELYDAIVSGRGGVEAFSTVQREMAWSLVKVLAAMRSCDGAASGRMAASVASLEALLPPVVDQRTQAAPLSDRWDIGALPEYDFAFVLTAACAQFGGENVILRDGSFDIPAPFTALSELVTRFDAVRAENADLQEALRRARSALEARNLGDLIAGLQGAPGKATGEPGGDGGPEAPVATENAPPAARRRPGAPREMPAPTPSSDPDMTVGGVVAGGALDRFSNRL